MRTRTTGTDFTDLVGCELPIQLAPMGAVGQAPALPAAVAEAGAHPVYPAFGLSPDRLAEGLDRLAETTDAFGANFIAPLLDPGCLVVALERAPVLDFFYGDPDAGLIRRVHQAGALVSWQVGSRSEAIAAAEAGCDLIVAQGVEAGGRIRGSLGLDALLDQIVDSVQVPVLAAGGIATAEDVDMALAAGASGVRVGTRLIASEEADAHPAWKAALVEAAAEDAVITRAFSVGVPDFPHRVLRSSIEAAEAHGPGPVAEIELDDRRVQVERFESHPPTSSATGAIEAMPFYAGQSAGAVRSIRPAAEIVAELADAAKPIATRA